MKARVISGRDRFGNSHWTCICSSFLCLWNFGSLEGNPSMGIDIDLSHMFNICRAVRSDHFHDGRRIPGRTGLISDHH